MWWLTVGCESPRKSVRSHTHTASRAVASRFTMRTRCGSPSALKSDAIVAASSEVMSSAPIGTQHWAGASITSICFATIAPSSHPGTHRRLSISL